MQYTLEMEPAKMVLPKKGARARQYVLPPEIIVMVDYLSMVSGRHKPEVVADAIQMAAILRKYISTEDLQKILEEDSLERLKDALSRALEKGDCG